MVVIATRLESLLQNELVDRLLYVEIYSTNDQSCQWRFVQLEKNALNMWQYIRMETIEINTVPTSIPNSVLEKKVWCPLINLYAT